MIADRQATDVVSGYTPPLGPVEEIVSNESPMKSSFSLWVSGSLDLLKNALSEGLELIGRGIFGKLNAGVQLFLEPSEIPRLNSSMKYIASFSDVPKQRRRECGIGGSLQSRSASSASRLVKRLSIRAAFFLAFAVSTGDLLTSTCSCCVQHAFITLGTYLPNCHSHSPTRLGPNQNLVSRDDLRLGWFSILRFLVRDR